MVFETRTVFEIYADFSTSINRPLPLLTTPPNSEYREHACSCERVRCSQALRCRVPALSRAGTCCMCRPGNFPRACCTCVGTLCTAHKCVLRTRKRLTKCVTSRTGQNVHYPLDVASGVPAPRAARKYPCSFLVLPMFFSCCERFMDQVSFKR